MCICAINQFILCVGDFIKVLAIDGWANFLERKSFKRSSKSRVSGVIKNNDMFIKLIHNFYIINNVYVTN